MRLPPSASSASPSRAVRRLLRVAPMAAVLGLLLAAAPAQADVPSGWSDPDDVTATEYLWVLLGAPLLVIAVVALLAYLPALTHGEKIGAGAGTAEDTWFGGPTEGTHELTAPAPERETGGASGRW